MVLRPVPGTRFTLHKFRITITSVRVRAPSVRPGRRTQVWPEDMAGAPGPGSDPCLVHCGLSPAF